MILIISKHITPHAVWKHKAGMKCFNATAKLSFKEQKHSEYFIKHFNGQANYKEAMPKGERVEFSVYCQGINGEFEDKMVKQVDWEPFKL